MELTIPRGRQTDAADLARTLDTLDTLGANLDRPQIKRARAVITRAGQIDRQAGDDRGNVDTIKADAARAYAAGTITTEELRAAAVAASLTADRTSPLYGMYASAARHVITEALDALTELGDEWVSGIMRPVVNDLTAAVLADIPPAMAARTYPRDTASADLLYGRLDAQLAHGRLRQVHAAANVLRVLHVIPATVRETSCWEWNTSMGERAETGEDLATFVYLAHRGHKPGIYTETEAAAAEAAAPTTTLTASDRAAAHARAAQLATRGY